MIIKSSPDSLNSKKQGVLAIILIFLFALMIIEKAIYPQINALYFNLTEFIEIKNDDNSIIMKNEILKIEHTKNINNLSEISVEKTNTQKTLDSIISELRKSDHNSDCSLTNNPEVTSTQLNKTTNLTMVAILFGETNSCTQLISSLHNINVSKILITAREDNNVQIEIYFSTTSFDNEKYESEKY